MNEIENIVDVLIEKTSSDQIVWKEKLTFFTKDTKKNYIYISEDSLSEFEIDLDITDDKKIFANLTIRNKDLRNGQKFISRYDFFKINNLGKLVYEKFVIQTLPNFKDEKEVISGILNSIGDRKNNRDIRISKILNETQTTQKDIQKEYKYTNKEGEFTKFIKRLIKWKR